MLSNSPYGDRQEPQKLLHITEWPDFELRLALTFIQFDF